MCPRRKTDDSPPASLERYRAKRDPDRTPEPFGGLGKRRAGARFVVHMHAARQLHYDLRLEIDGALKSWAVPRGPSVHPEEKRLAVHVEDHPLEYGDFEGVIPPGNYGAGNSMLWDDGTFTTFKTESDVQTQYERGRLELEFFGYKMRGRWTLFRTSRGNDWLLVKKVGPGTSTVELIDRYPESVVSGLRVEDLSRIGEKRAELARALEATDAPQREVAPDARDLMLATLTREPFDDDGWIYEIKYDGVRVLAHRNGTRVTLTGRSGQDITARYPDVAEAVLALPYDAFLLDGEIIAPDASGQPSFHRLQARMHLTRAADVERARALVPANAVFFDALAIGGHDLRRLPLVERKQLLRSILPPLGAVRFGDHVVGRGRATFDAAGALRLEGIVAKRASSAYVRGRSREWLKIKCDQRQEFVIGGYTDPQGSRAHFGSVHVGLYAGDELQYVSAVGSGFDAKTLRDIWQRLQPLARDTPPFAGELPPGGGHHWVEPELVCEVRFSEWTDEGGLRHPVFLGLRDDKKPRECVREDVPSLAEGDGGDAGAGSADPPPRREAPRTVRLTNLDKVFWPAERYTKGDLIAYYDAIAPLLLPYLANRPVFVTRFPDGIEGKSFYQKDAPSWRPSWVRTEIVYSGGDSRDIRYFVIDDADMLRYVINMGVIPLHPWSSRIGSLEQPDWMILDLDPKGAPFAHVIRIARTIKKLLDSLEIPSYPKTSGATGLHVLVPLGARYTYDQSRTFARLLATLVVHEERDIATIVRAVHAREGKVYVDFGQNAHGQTIVAPYSVRALQGAPASCPLRWSEVTARLDPARYTIRTIPERFARMEDPLRPVLGEGIRMEDALGRLAPLLERLTPDERAGA